MNEEFFNEQEAIGSEDALKRLKTMADELVAQTKLYDELESSLESLKKEITKLKTLSIPDLMAECGLVDFTIDDGHRVVVENFVAGTLPKEAQKREEAIAWLEENDAADLIKTELTLVFEKRQHNEAMSLMNELHERGYDSSAKMGVHPMTLISHVNERLRKGEEVPLEKLGLFAGRTTKVKAPRAKKGK